MATMSLGQFASNLRSGMPKAVIPAALTKSIAGIIQNDIRRRFATGTAPNGTPWPKLKYPRISGGDQPLLDTGVLRASVQVTATADGVVARTNHPGAAIHQYGGVIRPKRGKYLAIPATKEAKRAGSPRRFPRPLKTQLGRNRNGGVMYELRGGVRVVQFYLSKKVTIPARPFMGISGQALVDIGTLAAEWGYAVVGSWATGLRAV
jgi:phage gpG-like protein